MSRLLCILYLLSFAFTGRICFPTTLYRQSDTLSATQSNIRYNKRSLAGTRVSRISLQFEFFVVNWWNTLLCLCSLSLSLSLSYTSYTVLGCQAAYEWLRCPSSKQTVNCFDIWACTCAHTHSHTKIRTYIRIHAPVNVTAARPVCQCFLKCCCCFLIFVRCCLLTPLAAYCCCCSVCCCCMYLQVLGKSGICKIYLGNL